MPILYHFEHSPFSRRTRLALMHKGVECELRETRSHAAWLTEARQRAGLRTIPVLTDGPHALGDSTAITRWLDAAYPTGPRIWPLDEANARVTLEITTLVDIALNGIVDLGTRYFALRGDPAWPGVAGEGQQRIQHALTTLAERVRPAGVAPLAPAGWSAADMWLYTAVAWIEGMPARRATSQNIAQILEVGGFALPGELRDWAKGQVERADVRALG